MCNCDERTDEEIERDERSARISENLMKSFMSIRVTDSGKLFTDMMSKAWSVNFSGMRACGPDGGIASEAQYTFCDGTKITWTRPNK